MVIICENWGEGRKNSRRGEGWGEHELTNPPLSSPSSHFFALAPIVMWPKSEKCFMHAENLGLSFSFVQHL